MKSLLYCASMMLLLFGCENALIREVELDGFPEHALPLINAYLNSADTLIRVSITHAEPAVGEVPDGQSVSDPMQDAQVWLKGPDGEASLAYSEEAGAYVIESENFSLLPGNWYTLRVLTARQQEATATCYIPSSQVHQESIVVEYTQTTDSEMASIGWKDLAGEKNYYYLHRYTYDYSYNPPLLVDDIGLFPVADTGQDGNMLYTELFDVPQNSEQSRNIYVLYQVDESFYRYHQSLKEVRSNTDNEFAEPFNLYSNISGGLGIFTAMNPQLRFALK